MEFSFSDEPKQGAAPATKLYSPKKKPAGRPAGSEKSRSRVKDGTADESAQKKRAPEPATAAFRIGIMFSGFLFAGMVLFTLSGYERISRAYADINTINNSIDETELRIKALDVQIECAVTIQDAQKTAETYGMSYPKQSQYVRVGDAIPVSGLAPAGTDTSLGETVIPGDSGQPAENTPAEDVPSDD